MPGKVEDQDARGTPGVLARGRGRPPPMAGSRSEVGADAGGRRLFGDRATVFLASQASVCQARYSTKA